MEHKRPIPWILLTGLFIAFLGIGSFFGIILHSSHTLPWGLDVEGWGISRWVEEVSYWLACIGSFVVLVGILWFIIRRRSLKAD